MSMNTAVIVKDGKVLLSFRGVDATVAVESTLDETSIYCSVRRSRLKAALATADAERLARAILRTIESARPGG